MGGVPSLGEFQSPHAGAMAESSGDNPIHVVTPGDTNVSEVDDPITYPQDEHRHTGYLSVGIYVEGGVVNN